MFLAIETGQHDLALKLIQSRQVLKRSELSEYAKQDKGSGRLTLDRKMRSKNIANALKSKAAPAVLSPREQRAKDNHIASI